MRHKKWIIFAALLLVLVWVACENVPTTPEMTQTEEPAMMGKASQAKAHHKATGEVWWTTGEVYRYARFEAHDNAPGKQSDRGSLYYTAQDGQEISILKADINWVDVKWDLHKAYFSGPITYGTGDYAGKVGAMVYCSVLDGGTPGCQGDMVKFNWSMLEPAHYVEEGNLTVH